MRIRLPLRLFLSYSVVAVVGAVVAAGRVGHGDVDASHAGLTDMAWRERAASFPLPISAEKRRALRKKRPPRITGRPHILPNRRREVRQQAR